MKRSKKIMTLTLTLCLLLATVLNAHAAILEDVTEKTLIKGVTYQNIKRLYENGWQDIFVLRADLNEPHLAFEILKNPQGESFLQNTFSMATANDTIGAVNADFFAAKRGQSGRGSAVGIEIIDGQLKTTPATDEDMNALYQLEDGTLYFNKFTFDITLTAPNGATDKIRHINKYDDLNRIVLYNRDWNNLSLGASAGVIEVVVKDNIVVEKRRNAPPVEIPENGFILTENLEVHTFLDDNLNVGDKIQIDMTTAPNYNLIENAVSGGGILVNEGKVPTSFSHNIMGYQPRTAVGTDKTGKILYLVVVDGRRSLSKGMTQTELGHLMKELGCYTALNLDGGGSSLMAIKEDGAQKVVNTPSDGAYRAVTNSIGISSSAKLGDVQSVEIDTDSTNVFQNTSRWMWLNAFDKYYQKLEINQEEVKWSLIEGEGVIKDATFYPKASGKAKIKATYKDLSDTIELNVLEKPYTMEFTTGSLSLAAGSETLLWLNGRDENGTLAPIYPRDTDISFSNEIAAMNGNKVVAKKSGTTVLTAGFGQASANLALMIDTKETIKAPENKRIPDPMNKASDDKNAYRFTVFGNTRTPIKLYDVFIMNSTIAALKSHGAVTAFVGSDIDTSLLGDIEDRTFLSNSYSKTEREGNTFITVNNNSGDIFGSDKAQWDSLKNDLANVKNKNVFVFLNKYSLSSNQVEVKKLKEMLEALSQKGKNVMVFTGGFKNVVNIENGVRYATLGGVFESVGLKSPATNISYVKYLVVSVSGDKVTYEFKNIVG